MTAPIPPPDWYPDPSGAPTQRYWDGYKWGDSITPVKVFVSYFRHDEVAVRSMVGDLQRAGFPVWLEDLGGSYAWWTQIIEQIRECTVFLFAFSDGSLNAIPCRVELGYAEDLGLPIVLVQIGEVSRYASDPIVSRQSIDYRNPTAATRSALLAALNDHAAHRAELPDPLPEGPPIPVAYLHRLSRILDRDELAPLVQAQILRELRSALDAKQEPTGQSYRQGQVDGLLRALRRRPEVTDSIVTEVNSLLGPPSADEVSVYGGSMPDSNRDRKPTRSGQQARCGPCRVVRRDTRFVEQDGAARFFRSDQLLVDSCGRSTVQLGVCAPGGGARRDIPCASLCPLARAGGAGSRPSPRVRRNDAAQGRCRAGTERNRGRTTVVRVATTGAARRRSCPVNGLERSPGGGAVRGKRPDILWAASRHRNGDDQPRLGTNWAPQVQSDRAWARRHAQPGHQNRTYSRNAPLSKGIHLLCDNRSKRGPQADPNARRCRYRVLSGHSHRQTGRTVGAPSVYRD